MVFLCVIVFIVTVGLHTTISNELQSNLDSCRAKYYSCESTKYNMCRCDRLCRYYDDCCFDVNDKLGDETANDGSIIPSTGETIPFLGETTCVKISSVKSSRGVFMVSSCPKTWKNDNKVKYKCISNSSKEFFDFIPVFDRSTNVTFKNRNCALCHNVHHWIPWRLNITCGNLFYLRDVQLTQSWKDEVMLKIYSKHCNYKLLPSKHVYTRYCSHYHKYDLWNKMDEVNLTSCNNRVFSPFLFGKFNHVKQYRNLQCLLNEKGPNPFNVGLAFLSCVEIHTPFEKTSNTIRNLIDISAIFLTPDSTSSCSGTEIYLSDQVGCQTLYCPVDMESVRGSCVLIKYQTNGIVLDLLFESNVAIINRAFAELTAFVLDTVYTNNVSLSHTTNYCGERSKGSRIIEGYHVNSMEPCSLIQFRCMVEEQKYRKVTSDYNRLIVTNLFEKYEQNLSNGVYVKHVYDVIEADCKCNESLKNPSYVANQVPQDSSLPCPAVKVYSHGNCSDSNDSNSNLLNMTRYRQLFTLNGIVIEPEDVLLQFGSYFICVDTFLSKYQEDKNKHDLSMAYYRYVANTICTSISIISLIYSLIQYCCIPFLRQGKTELLFLLMLYLLIAQTAFLFLSHITLTTDLCGWFGLLHHFVWIGSFTFMFLCCYRLNAEIRNLSVLTKSKRFSETVKYGLCGFVFSILIVLCTKILNLILAPAENWYGGDICFISNVHVLLLAFILPIALFLCGNITLFVLIVYYIRTTAIANDNATYKSLSFVFIKISFIMGFSWIIGIIAVFVQSELLLIIFESVSSLQGMLLTISFLCNNRVYNFYRDISLKDSKPSIGRPRPIVNRY